LVGIGVLIALGAEALRIPSLPFAVGVYLPVATMVPVFLGGLLRLVLTRRAASPEEGVARRDRGVLLGSGLVGGEGLLGIGIAGMAAWAAARSVEPWQIGHEWLGDFASLAGLGVFALLILLFAGVCLRRETRG
jgi:uncharacterized oligopeptide transporter (OPT) family protein